MSTSVFTHFRKDWKGIKLIRIALCGEHSESSWTAALSQTSEWSFPIFMKKFWSSVPCAYWLHFIHNLSLSLNECSFSKNCQAKLFRYNSFVIIHRRTMIMSTATTTTTQTTATTTWKHLHLWFGLLWLFDGLLHHIGLYTCAIAHTHIWAKALREGKNNCNEMQWNMSDCLFVYMREFALRSAFMISQCWHSCY